MTDPLALAAAFVIGTLGVARAVRLLTHDAYPPAQALRRWWWGKTVGRGGRWEAWHLLLVGEQADEPGCPYCCAPYVAAVALATALAAGVWAPGWSWASAWLVAAVWAASAYVAAMIVASDFG